MATDYFNTYQSTVATRSLPTPATTPSTSPNLSHGTMPPRLTTRRSHSSRQYLSEIEDWETLSADGAPAGPDPSIITPSIHASLVSEILSLRRELESKNGFVDHLESNLQAAKSETEALTSRLLESTKQTKVAQRHVAQIERETFEEVNNLVLERDQAHKVNAELRNKADSATRKIRGHEEEVAHIHQKWELEKQAWDDERRQLERRVHVTEERLRAVAEELSVQYSVHPNDHDSASQANGTWKDSGLGHESDTGSIRSYRTRRHSRTRSNQSLASTSTSFQSPSRVRNPAKSAGFSLADELDVEEEDDFDLDEFNHPDDRFMRRESHQSLRSDPEAKARKVLGLMADHVSPATVHEGSAYAFPRSEPSASPVLRRIPSLPARHQTAVDRGVRPTDTYEETDVQHSSHTLPRAYVPIAAESTSQHDSGTWPALHGLGNKHVADSMASASTQTSDFFQYGFAYTQTDIAPVEVAPDNGANSSKSSSLSVLIPSIAIHPPHSGPSSPTDAVLPPGTKSAASQTEIEGVSIMCDAAIQTEEIRVDTRQAKLPAHLRSDALDPPENKSLVQEMTMWDGRPTKSTSDDIRLSAPLVPASRMTRALPLKALPLPQPQLRSESPDRSLQKSLENGPLNRTHQYGTTQTLKSSNFLAGLHNDSDHESDYMDEADLAEDRYFLGSAPALSRSAALGSRSKHPMTVPEDVEMTLERDGGDQFGDRRNSPWKQRSDHVPTRTASKGWKRQGMNFKLPYGSHSHSRSRSPSLDTVGSSAFSVQSRPPPYPIPTRSSSRVTARQSGSEGPRSPTRREGGSVSSRRTDKSLTKPRVTGLRKVQSANMMRSQARMSPRRRKRAPQLSPIQSMAFEGPVMTRFPIPDVHADGHDLISPITDLPFGQESNQTTEQGNAECSAQDTSMVDAIASAMIGEFMYKYVSKRKTFGQLGDSSRDFTEDGLAKSNAVRHKRWVWISPYEKTIMWNAKQPANGSALMGKAGRKLVIRSVLDVKDNNSAPRGVTPDAVFGRSIVVLTPTRALKFTATSKERHYTWLMALSFLANPSQGPPQVPRLPTAVPAKRSAQDVPADAQPDTVLEQSVTQAQNRSHAPTQAPGYQWKTNASDLSSQQALPSSRGASISAIPRSLANRHSRKRSSTGPSISAPFSSLRSFSSNAFVQSPSKFTFASSSRPPQSPVKHSRGTTLTTRQSADFVGEDGMMRMEAFVDPSYEDGVLYVPPRMPATVKVGSRRRQDSQNSMATFDRARAGYIFDADGRDPFHGF